jgi:hypothetical protein
MNGEPFREGRVAELIHALGSFEILQPVLAEIPQGGFGGKGGSNLRGGCSRQERLPPMRAGAEPCAAADLYSVEVAVTDLDLPSVDADPDT